MCQLCSVCTVTGPFEAGETATLCQLIGNLQDALAQATRVIAAMANGLWGGHAAPLETASSVDSVPVPDVVSPLLASAPGYMAWVNPVVKAWTHGLSACPGD